jgi:NAD-dependent dihydropyrimidine dehydrogenase PreA subunit
MIRSIDPDLCFGCGDCDMGCPMDVIYLDPVSQIAEIRYPQDCMTCYSCEVECPVDAVFVDPIKNPKPQAW